MKKLTDRSVRAAAPGSYGDVACPGLRLRVSANGVRTFAFAYRNKALGKVKWLTLGHYPELSLADAHQHANDARKVAAAGGTPVSPAQRAAAEHAKTYAELVEDFYEGHLKALRSGKDTRTSLRRIGRVYRWNDRPAASITDDDAAAMLHHIAVVRGKKANANQTKHLLHRMFKWAKQPGRKHVTVNPFADLPPPGGTIPSRERFLTADEIGQVWRALDDPDALGIRPDAATALRLILVTAARPGMVRGMVGRELCDLRGPSKHGPHWSLPGLRMKGKKPFIAPLSGLALDLIRLNLKDDPAAPMFDLPRYYLDHAARRIVERLGMQRWTPHDLRRTAGTILDGHGYSLEKIGGLLAHTRKGTTAIYARFEHLGLRQEMAAVIEDSLRTTLAQPSGTADTVTTEIAVAA